ncbi:uncharacterized protein LOC123551528 [Mercenaria mercenaria]|uniref:uncharacterized protein LOC123551528 n=1 Tax=Mercenaria mercenaria TaxID=6596 RepID=UPI00234EB80B|nr:uncharacterized protein LOC123551528 [Mercenaria mercenaria]
MENMDDDIFEDLEKLFEECDDVTKSFNESAVTDCTVVHKAENDDSQSDQVSKSEIAQSDASEHSVKRSWKIIKKDDGIKSGKSSSTERKCTDASVYGNSLHNKKENVGKIKPFRNNSSSFAESSMEEGECSATLLEDCTVTEQLDNTKTDEERNGQIHQERNKKGKVKPEVNYSSFIESSREEGECSTTSFEEEELETTVKEVSPEQTNEDTIVTETNKENKQLLLFKQEKEGFDNHNNLKKRKRSISERNENTPKRCPEQTNEDTVITETDKEKKQLLLFKQEKEGFNNHNNLKKRKRSILETNENTPKRRHIFISDDVLSPISCLSGDKRRNTIEMAETPLIELKFNFQTNDICSSTPVTTSQTFSFPSGGNCSTPISATNTFKQSNLAKKEILKSKELPDSDSDFEAFSDVEEVAGKHQTVDELIAEITQLCGDIDEAAEGESSDNDEVREKSDKTVSKIEVSDLINEWKTRSSCESASETEASSYSDITRYKLVNEWKTRSSCESTSETEASSCSDITRYKLVNEWKTRSSCERSYDTDVGSDGDKTLTENVEACSQNEGTETGDSDIENLTVLSAVGSFKMSEKENKNDENLTEDKGGRFTAEVTVSRIEVDKINETNREVIDMDISDIDGQDLQYGEDLLNLDDYDDEGFVDANVLEKSHITKELNLTMKVKDATENNNNVTDKGQEIGEYKDSLFELVSGLRKEAGDKTKSVEKAKKDINENVVKGLDYATFDTSIYRKNENTAIEREICRRWGTNGSADPDLNLTVASTKRNRCNETGEEPESGFLEGDRVVCTYLYEEEIVSSFQHYGKTEGQSDLCYMTLENLLRKLHNQKNILENMNKQSLLNIKGELQWQLSGTKQRHREEMEALKYRQAMEDERFRFNSRNQFNVMEFQHRLMQLRQDHISQQGRLKEHHQNEFCAVRSRGMETLHEEIGRHSAQCEPIDQLIEQLEKPESHSKYSPQKYGPPIVVSLRKGPCKATHGRHSTVPVCLSAAIAQAVSLEDDLYDHYYGY